MPEPLDSIRNALLTRECKTLQIAGQTVFVRALTVKQMLAIEEDPLATDGLSKIILCTIKACATQESSLFDRSDFHRLADGSFFQMSQLFKLVAEMNGLVEKKEGDRPNAFCAS